MSNQWVPDGFDPPTTYHGEGFHLEPLGPVHNERDHEAWMSSIDHIRSTPGMDWREWPAPMSLDENMADMEMHANEFERREGFTYSILDGDEVIGCVYIYPDERPGLDAQVRSWVTASRADLDVVVYRDLSRWLAEEWPFEAVDYAER